MGQVGSLACVAFRSRISDRPPPLRPKPQTGCAARRTVILPPLSRLNRVQLENLAVQWEVDPRGKTVAQIRDALYELDKDMREGRRTVPGKRT